MALDAGPVRKILELEAQKGYRDSAVIGGLDRFVDRWLVQSSGPLSGPAVKVLLSRLKKARYNSLDAIKRAEWIAGFLEILSIAESPESVAGTTSQSSGLSQTRRRNKPAVPAASASVVKTKIDAHGPLDSPVTIIKGISANTASRFRRLGVKTIRDLLYFFPRRHLDYSQRKPISMLAEGRDETIVAHVWEARVVNIGKRRSTEAVIGEFN